MKARRPSESGSPKPAVVLRFSSQANSAASTSKVEHAVPDPTLPISVVALNVH